MSCGRVWEFAGRDLGPCQRPAGHDSGCAFPYLEPSAVEDRAARLEVAMREVQRIAAEALA